MAKLEVNPQEFDSRMVEWNLKVNKITQKQLEDYLKSLPDESANTETLSLDDEDNSSQSPT